MNKFLIKFGRFSIFVIYFWFGFLKVIGESPANPLVKALMQKTLPFLTFEQFIIAFGIFEMIIGLAFLFPRFQKIAVALLLIHMVTTAMPLFLVKKAVWSSMLVPTLEGQYIIKNIAIIALALSLAAHAKDRG